MDNDRFGPIRPDNETPKPHYHWNKNGIITFLMIIVIIVLVIYMVRDVKNKKAHPQVYASGTYSSAYSIVLPTVEESGSPTVSLRPVAEKVGMLPIFYRANTDQKRVAITLDNCSDSSAINKLLGICAENSIKLTFFPTGTEISAHPDLWATVALGGHEIENHTDTNARLSQLSIVKRETEITAQTERLRNIIGADYVPHFLRTDNWEDDSDESLHTFLAENGYFGIARWAHNTPRSFSDIEPGQILCYSATSAGVQTLSSAITVLIDNGYEIVTLNELFAYPENMESTEDDSGIHEF